MGALWALVVLLVLSRVAVWFTSTPVYASGLAIVVDTKKRTILIQVNTSSKP
jgi:hypothetical protein